MPNIPFFYDYQNLAASNDQPANQFILTTEMGRFYARYLLKKAISVFKWSFPEWWDKDYFLYVLYCWGYIAILDTAKFGVIPQQCGLSGYNVFYRPKTAIITNPLITDIERREIDKDCVLFKLQADYTGIMDLVTHYAAKMALASESIDNNLWNTKLAAIFFADGDAAQQAFKKAYDRISGGDPMVVIRKNLRDENGKLPYEMFNRDVKASYIVDDLLVALRQIEAEYDTRIGIPNANTDKRERLITDEVNANNVETNILVDGWKDNIDKGIADVREMFELEITCERRYSNADISDNESVRSIQTETIDF